MTVLKVGENIKVGKNVKIGKGTIIYDNVIIKNNVVIHPYAIIGNTPQHTTKDQNLLGKTIIGENTIIREFVTIHSPMDEEKTEIGKNCYIMATAHIGHDCLLKNNVVLSNSVNLSGHTRIGNNVTIGLNSATHQFTTIGDFSMIGMNTPINRDVLPYTISYGSPIRWYKINKVGILRHANEKILTEVERILGFGEQVYITYAEETQKVIKNSIITLGRKSKYTDIRKSFSWFDNNRKRGNRQLIKFAGEKGYNLEYRV